MMDSRKTRIITLVLAIILTLYLMFTLYLNLALIFTSKIPQSGFQIYSGKLVREENLSKIKILEVPFFHQKPWFCSEASASMVLAYFGYNLTQDEINSLGYDRFENMLPLLSTYLGECHYKSLNVEEIKSEINKGKPAILRIKVDGYLHTIVVVGYDENFLYIHDPAIGAYLKCKPEKLLEVWKPTGFKAIVINGNEC